MDCNKFSISKLRGKFRKNNLNAEKPAAIYTQGAYVILYTVHICNTHFHTNMHILLHTKMVCTHHLTYLHSSDMV